MNTMPQKPSQNFKNDEINEGSQKEIRMFDQRGQHSSCLKGYDLNDTGCVVGDGTYWV